MTKNLSGFAQKILTKNEMKNIRGGNPPGEGGCTYNCSEGSPVSYSDCTGGCYALNEPPYGVGCTSETPPNDKKWCK